MRLLEKKTPRISGRLYRECSLKPLQQGRAEGVRLSRARFRVGQPIRHKLFHYRGVIVDVDATCQASNDWYDRQALTRPPRDRPWYHVLVHSATHMTYVAERNLEPDLSGRPIDNPALDAYFVGKEAGLYVKESAGH